MTDFIDNVSNEMNKLTLEEAQIEINKLHYEIDRLRRKATSFGESYTLKQKIGEGQFGVVHESVRNKDDFRVAVKIVVRSILDTQVIIKLTIKLIMLINININININRMNKIFFVK
jgi:serine/threonine protein kinase